LRVLENADPYMDNVGIRYDTWESHLETLTRTLKALDQNGFAIDPAKCKWGVQTTKWLGHILTPEGIKSDPKKVEVILAMQPPTTLKQLRSFIGAVNYYCDMWPQRSGLMVLLRQLTSAPKFVWDDTHQKAFKQLKSVISTETMLVYPNHELPWQVETDASDYQLVAVLKQEQKIVAYFLHKLNPAQHNYTTIEKELLCIIKMLRECCCWLLGATMTVNTNHKHLTFSLCCATRNSVFCVGVSSSNSMRLSLSTCKAQKQDS
jgi:RNase H-like domain found in reverse transcriptase